MGFLLKPEVFDGVLKELGQTYRLYAPVRKKGEGRYTDVDVVRYDFIQSADEIEMEAKSDYAFKEFLTPLSQTLFFFTENEVKEADIDEKPVLIFLRSCDMHAVRRLDHMYLENGAEKDPFYERLREQASVSIWEAMRRKRDMCSQSTMRTVSTAARSSTMRSRRSFPKQTVRRRMWSRAL